MKIIFTLKRSSLGLNCKRISYVKNSRKLAAVVAQLAEGSIPTTEDLCSNPAISNFSTENVFPLTFGKTKMIEKGQDCPLLITNGTQTWTIGVTDIVLTTEPARNYSFWIAIAEQSFLVSFVPQWSSFLPQTQVTCGATIAQQIRLHITS